MAVGRTFLRGRLHREAVREEPFDHLEVPLECGEMQRVLPVLRVVAVRSSGGSGWWRSKQYRSVVSSAMRCPQLTASTTLLESDVSDASSVAMSAFEAACRNGGRGAAAALDSFDMVLLKAECDSLSVE